MNKHKLDILIIKLSAIGDVVHSLPLLEVLRGRFPSSRIDWVIEEAASNIVEGHPDLDKVIVFPRKGWLDRFTRKREYISVGRELITFFEELRKREYDLVIDLQGLLKSGVLTFFARGSRKIGLNGAREGSSLFVNERVNFPEPEIHALDRYLCVAKHLGVADPVWKGKIPIYETDKRYVDDLLVGLEGNCALVAINPMAKWESKLWELERFACLADVINEKLEAAIIFTGSESDRIAVEKIVAGMRTKALNLAGKTNLKQLAYLYKKCAVVISTDTGPMHMAAAMGSSVVALFGPTSALRTGPYGRKHRVVRTGLPCSPCFRKRCDHMSCMKGISVEQVYDTVKQVIDIQF
jgi:heptosyltransferase-1